MEETFSNSWINKCSVIALQKTLPGLQVVDLIFLWCGETISKDFRIRAQALSLFYRWRWRRSTAMPWLCGTFRYGMHLRTWCLCPFIGTSLYCVVETNIVCWHQWWLSSLWRIDGKSENNRVFTFYMFFEWMLFFDIYTFVLTFIREWVCSKVSKSERIDWFELNELKVRPFIERFVIFMKGNILALQVSHFKLSLIFIQEQGRGLFKGFKIWKDRR